MGLGLRYSLAPPEGGPGMKGTSSPPEPSGEQARERQSARSVLENNSRSSWIDLSGRFR